MAVLGDALGQAWVGIVPGGFAEFGARAKAGIDAALTGVKPEVKVGASADKASIAATIAQIQAALKAASKTQGGLADLIDLNVPQGQIVSQLLMLRRLIQQTGLSDMLGINLNDSQIRQQLDKLAQLSADITVGADTGPAAGALAALKAQIAALSGRAAELAVNVGVNDTEAQATITRLLAQLTALSARVTRLPVDVQVNDASFLYAQARALDVAAALDRVSASMRGANSAVADAIPLWTAGGGAWSFLTGHVQLFGGTLTQIGIPAILATASGLHLVIDAIVETAGTLIPAAVAFTAFGVAAVPTVQDLISQMQTLHSVTQAFGVNLYPLTGGFQAMADAVQPEVYVLFGEALDTINAKSGVLSGVAVAAGRVLDGLGARFEYAITQGNTFSTLMQHAAQDLQGWGDVIGNIGGIIGGVLKTLPGYAEILLNVLDSLTHVIEGVVNSGFGQWFLTIGLAAHGALIYIGLFATGLTALANNVFPLIGNLAATVATKVEGFGVAGAKAAAGLDAITVAAAEAGALPWGWIAVAVAGLGFLIVQTLKAQSTLQQFFTDLQQQAQNAPLVNLSATLGTQLAQAQKDVADATVAAAAAHAHFTQVVQDSTQTQVGNAAAVVAAGQAYANAQGVLAGYQQGLAGIQREQGTYNQHLAEAAKVFGSTTAAQNALTAAGITSGQMLDTNAQHWAEALIEAQAYDSALRAVTETAGRYGAAQNAMNFAAGNSANALGQADAAMSKVTQAEDQLLATITGGQTALDTFGQGLYTLADNFNQVTGSTATTSFTLDHIKSSASLAGASLAGTSQASYALNQAFYAQIGNAQQLYDKLDLMAVSTRTLQTVVGTTAGQLLNFAGTNTEARTVIVDLINNALGPGTVSLKNLNSWVAQNSTTMQGLNSDIAAATINASTLAGTLQQDLNNQFHQFLLQTSGADTALKIYTGDLVHNQTTTSQGRQDRLNLIADLENAGLSAQQAQQYVDGLNRSLGKIPPVTRADLSETATGTYKIVAGSVAVQGGGSLVQGGAAHGMYLHPNLGTPGQDSVLIRAMPGELVVPANLVPAVAPVLTGKIPGFASGGLIPAADTLQELAPATDAFHAAFVNTVTGALEKATTAAALAAQQSAMFGLTGPGIQAGAAVLAYASQFAGKVPYVWGGSTPAGWDCSGFVSWVYDKFGIYNGRTDAAGLQSWGKTAGPTPGGMVFFGDPAYHVGFIVNDSTMLSALGTQWGTTYSSLAGNSGFEVPPQWAAQSTTMPGGVGWVPGNPQSGSAAAAEAFAQSILWAFGWGQNEWPALYNLWQRESGWNAWAQNPSSGAAGIPQDIRGWADYAPGDFANQVRWGLAYISGRYGSPDAAWGHELAQGWYAHGGLIPGAAQGIVVPGTHPGGHGPAVTPQQAWIAANFGPFPVGYGNWSTGSWWAEAETAQAQEQRDYAAIQAGFKASLAKAKKGTWEYGARGTIEHELTTLAARQAAEKAAYMGLGPVGSVVSATAMNRLRLAAGSAGAVAKDADLIQGHPALMAGMYYWLGRVAQAAGTHISQGVTPWPSLFSTPALPKKGSSGYDTLAGIYGFDSGGWIPPGVSLAVNNTGQPERVLAPGTSGPLPAGSTLTERQGWLIIDLLRQLVTIGRANPGALGQVLNGVAATSAARGYYGGSR